MTNANTDANATRHYGNNFHYFSTSNCGADARYSHDTPPCTAECSLPYYSARFSIRRPRTLTPTSKRYTIDTYTKNITNM